MKKPLFILLILFSYNFLFSQSLTIVTNPSIICSGYFSTLTVLGNTFSNNSYTWTASSNSIILPNVNTTSISITCSIQGTYTITCTALSGSNIIQAQTTVIVGPNLNINVTANSLTTCIEANSLKLSKPVYLLASGANSYVWFPYSGPFVPSSNTSTQVVRPSTSTCYTVLGMSSVCSGSGVICITVLPQFSISVVPSNPTICVGDQINLKIQNISTLALGPASAFTYSWTDPQVISMNPAAGLSDSVFVFPNSSVTYTADMRDSRGCVSLPQTINVTVEKCTVLKQNDLHDLQIFPNPVSDFMYLKNANRQIQTLELIDLNGRIMLSIKELELRRSEDDIQVALRSIEAGLYFLKVINENGSLIFAKITKI
jgi:hypothetical protein